MCILMECLTSSYSFICDASLRHSFLFVQFCSLQQRELEISSWHSVLILALYQISNKLPAWSIKLLLHLTLLCPIAELQSKLTFSLGAPAEWHVTVGVWFRWKPLGSDLKVSLRLPLNPLLVEGGRAANTTWCFHCPLWCWCQSTHSGWVRSTVLCLYKNISTERLRDNFGWTVDMVLATAVALVCSKHEKGNVAFLLGDVTYFFPLSPWRAVKFLVPSTCCMHAEWWLHSSLKCTLTTAIYFISSHLPWKDFESRYRHLSLSPFFFNINLAWLLSLLQPEKWVK